MALPGFLSMMANPSDPHLGQARLRGLAHRYPIVWAFGKAGSESQPCMASTRQTSDAGLRAVRTTGSGSPRGGLNHRVRGEAHA